MRWRLDDIRAKIAESLDDPRPSLIAREVGKRVKKLHKKTVKARARLKSPDRRPRFG